MRTGSTSTVPRWKLGLAATLLVVLLTWITGCGQRPEVAKSPCPSRDLVSYTAVDLSDSARDASLVAARLKLVQESLTETAVCSGTARVVAFTNSEAATALLFDRELKPEGATDQARRRRAPKLVDAAMGELEGNLEQAKVSLPGGGTDVVAQLRLVDEFHRQVGSDRKLIARILTDGITTTGVVLNRPDLNESVAIDLANGISVPTMSPSTEVVFAGIGRVSGPDIPPTEFTNAVKAFFTTLCGRLGAGSCVPVSDLTLGVKK